MKRWGGAIMSCRKYSIIAENKPFREKQSYVCYYPENLSL